MDPELFNLYLQAMSGQKDASSAAFDPVLALMTGLYQPKSQFSEEQLYSKLAPMISFAGAEQAGPRFEAAAAIRGGRAPWDLKKDKSLRGNMDSKEWEKLVDDMFKENEKVKGKLLDLEMEQDPFQKQGLPGYADKYKPEDMYKFAPKAFSKILEGLPEAQAIEDPLMKRISSKYDTPVMISGDKERLAKLMQDNKYALALSRGDVRVHERQGLTGSPWRALNPQNWTDEGINTIKDIFSPADKNDERKAIERMAKADLAKMGNTPILDQGATAKNKAYGDYVKSIVARKTGSASGKLKNAEKLAGQIQTELESQGRSPLYDAILRQAAMGGKLK
jgi:hypothetical protein